MTNPSPVKRWVLAGAAAAGLLAVVVGVLLYANRFEYDETAHRNVIEGYGGPVADWDAYQDAVFESCGFDEQTFAAYVAMETDLNRLQLDIEYACPDRMDEFTDLTGMEPLN